MPTRKQRRLSAITAYVVQHHLQRITPRKTIATGHRLGSVVAQNPTDYVAVSKIPEVVAYCSPDAVVPNFDATFVWGVAVT